MTEVYREYEIHCRLVDEQRGAYAATAYPIDDSDLNQWVQASICTHQVTGPDAPARALATVKNMIDAYLDEGVQEE